MSEETRDIATGLAQEMLGQAASGGMPVAEMPEQEEAPEPVAEEVPVEPTASEQVVEDMTEAAEEQFVELPSFAPVPEEEFAGFEDEEAEETLTRLDELLNNEEGYTEIEDEDELRAEVHKLRKQVNYQRELRAKAEKKRWAEEARAKYNLANVDLITAQSRNAFMKAAALSHNQNYALLKPHVDALEEQKKTIAERVKAEAKEEAVKAWGTPTMQPNVSDMDDATFEKGLEEARKGGLEKVIRFMRESGR